MAIQLRPPKKINNKISLKKVNGGIKPSTRSAEIYGRV